MSEEKPYWQQRRDMKNGKTLPPAEAKKEKKVSLAAWYEVQHTQSPANCENCGANLAATVLRHPHGHICHIVPKTAQGGCPSVATHPLNRWFGCQDCHDLYDKGKQEDAAQMPIITMLRARMKQIYPKIKKSELRRVQPFLLPATMVPKKYKFVIDEKAGIIY